MKKKLIFVLVIMIIAASAFLGYRKFIASAIRDVKSVTPLSVLWVKDNKEYHFTLDAFQKAGVTYLSLNDFYNIVKIEDTSAKVKVKNRQMIFTQKQGTTIYDYGKDTVTINYTPQTTAGIKVLNNSTVVLQDGEMACYKHEKELFFPLELTKIMVENYDISLNFKNKSATIK